MGAGRLAEVVSVRPPRRAEGRTRGGQRGAGLRGGRADITSFIRDLDKHRYLDIPQWTNWPATDQSCRMPNNLHEENT